MGIVLLVLVVLGASADSFSHFKASKSEQTKPEVIVHNENPKVHTPSQEHKNSEITNDQNEF